MLADRDIEVEGVAASVVGRRILAIELETDGAREVETKFGIELGECSVNVADPAVEGEVREFALLVAAGRDVHGSAG